MFLTFNLHLLGDLVDVVLGTSISEDHEYFGDSPPDTSLRSEDGVLYVLYGFPFKQTADWGLISPKKNPQQNINSQPLLKKEVQRNMNFKGPKVESK